MKLMYILFFIFLLFFVTGCTKYEKYRYFVVTPNDNYIEETLNSWGEKGCVIDSTRRVIDEKDDNLIYNPEAKYEIIFRCPYNTV